MVLRKILSRFLLIATIFLALATATAQQPACKLKLGELPDAPELRGFRLGMTPDQVKAREPQVQFGRTDAFGVLKTSINPSFDPRFDKASFAGVRTISLDLLDGKLIVLWVGYDDTFKWQTIDDFTNGISKSLNLPPAWTAKRGGRELTCDGFSVLVAMIAGSPSIRITDGPAQETIATRREEAAAAAEAAAVAVVGDKRTKLYYPADCEAQQTIPEASRISFKDKDEAEKAGYKLARDC
jgi:hypothetical protein